MKQVLYFRSNTITALIALFIAVVLLLLSLSFFQSLYQQIDEMINTLVRVDQYLAIFPGN